MYLGYSAGTYTTPHLGDNEAKKAPIVMRREPMTIMAHSRITIPVGRSWKPSALGSNRSRHQRDKEAMGLVPRSP